MKKRTVLILGATGLLGSTLSATFKDAGAQVITQSRAAGADVTADLTSVAGVCRMLETCMPDTIVNLVGLTNVDLCEDDLHLAYQVNTRTTEYVVSAMSQTSLDSHLIQISTDQVYDGHGEHREGEVTMRNHYAITKYASELAALGGRATVLRTNFFGLSRTSNRQSLTDWIFGALSRREAIKVFEDVAFSPLSMRSLSVLMAEVAEKQPQGVFNLGSKNGMSKADFAFQFAEAAHLPAELMSRANSSEVKTLKAYRPKDMRMNCEKIEAAMGIALPDLTVEIQNVAREYVEKA